MTRVLITGATGQIGSALVALAPASLEIYSAARSLDADQPGHCAVDLSDPAAVNELLSDIRPEIIINAAAWTDVDAAEEQPDAAEILNAQLPRRLAEYALGNEALLVHYSTDYVFDGQQATPYSEADPVNPAGAYGRTKLAGEQAVLASGAAALILRTSWVYGGPTRNFLDTIAGKLRAGGSLRVVDDQHGCPTWGRDIAACTWHALAQLWPVQEGFKPALYHLAGVDESSWYAFAQRIETELGQLDMLPYDPQIASKVTPCGTAEYPRPAPRPANSRLNSDRFSRTFDCRPQGWDSVRQCLRRQVKVIQENNAC